MNKNLPKLVKHIFPSNEQRTRVWFARFRDLHLLFVSIGRVKVHVNGVDLVKTTCIIMLDLQPARMTYKIAASDEYILGIRKEARILSLQIINKKGQEQMV
jgi:hypothetical protein